MVMVHYLYLVFFTGILRRHFIFIINVISESMVMINWFTKLYFFSFEKPVLNFMIVFNCQPIFFESKVYCHLR